MVDITVLTTTYNRGRLLKNLYNSLCKQDCKDFEWLIIDDGSVDDTDKVVSQMKSNADFSIKYYRKPNGGKHTALNFAYHLVKTDLIFIVDSDDTLTTDAISVIKNTHSIYHGDSELCGYSFLRGKSNGGLLSTSGVPNDGMKESYVDCRINRNIGGDMAEVWFTKCLKEFPFPEIDGEKFLGEDIVWVRMAKKYKMRFFNQVIYISDYLEDGLTNNRRKHNIKSPKGCVARAEAFLDANVCMKIKIKAIIQYHIYGRFAGKRSIDLFSHSHDKFLYCLLFFPSNLLYTKWKKTYREVILSK